ncbi:MAG: ParA family protein [Deltaproteobacteria bacterium]|nr:MAG: ParA family protein [Deltaproteobacteria bacterium]
MLTVSFCQPKGGVGKTTLAFLVGSALSQMGLDTALFDLDREAPFLTRTMLRRGEVLDETHMPRLERLEALGEVASRYRALLFDVPGGLPDKTLLEYTQVLVIPVTHSSESIEMAEALIDRYVEIKGEDIRRRRRGVVLVPTMANASAVQTRTERHAKELLSGLSFPGVVSPPVYWREAIRLYMERGLSPWEAVNLGLADSRDADSAAKTYAEIEAVCNAIGQVLS